MRYLIKTFIFNALSFYVLNLLLGAVKFSSYEVLVLAAVVFSLLNVFVKPILKVLTFPINLLTFGLFSSLLNVFILYLVTRLIPQFQIVSFTIPSITLVNLTSSPIHVYGFWSYFLVSAALGFVSGIFWSILG